VHAVMHETLSATGSSKALQSWGCDATDVGQIGLQHVDAESSRDAGIESVSPFSKIRTAAAAAK
jgi:hypothetical protein